MLGIYYYYRPQKCSVREGNVFSLSFCPQEGFPYPIWTKGVPPTEGVPIPQTKGYPSTFVPTGYPCTPYITRGTPYGPRGYSLPIRTKEVPPSSDTWWIVSVPVLRETLKHSSGQRYHGPGHFIFLVCMSILFYSVHHPRIKLQRVRFS